MSGKRILIFIEDPGAANFIFPVLPDLTKANWEIELTAAGAAISFLADRNISATPFLPEMNASNYLKTCDVNIVMVGTSENSRTVAFELTEAAKKSGIPSIGFVDGPANVEHRFRGISTEPLVHAPDWLILTDHDTAYRFCDLGYPEERFIVTGHPYYDKLLTEAAALRTISTSEHRQIAIPNAPIEGPVIVFLGESSDGLGMDIKRKSASYTLCGWSGSQRRTNIILEEFLDAVATLSPKPYLVFRAHPKDHLSNYKDYLDDFDELSEGGSPLQLLFAATLTVGLSTSLLVEASLAGLNALSILPTDAQKYLVPTIKEGLTPCATSRKTLLKLLSSLVKNDGGDRQGPNVSSQGASARIIDAINMIGTGNRTL